MIKAWIIYVDLDTKAILLFNLLRPIYNYLRSVRLNVMKHIGEVTQILHQIEVSIYLEI